jgi:predicted Zn-dependent protease
MPPAPSPASHASRPSATSHPGERWGSAVNSASVPTEHHAPTSPPGERSPKDAKRSLPGEGAASPPAPEDDPLALAAECLSRGDNANAAVHLESHVRDHPEQLLFRLQLAELLVRLGRDDAAKTHFERFAADASGAKGAMKDHLVHAHTRLLEVAQRTGDRAGEEFHRGVGLLLLAKEQDASSERDEAFREQMLCKAMKAFNAAKEMNPGDPRVRAYLAEVYDRMGNRRAADTERTAARGSVVPTGLPPTLR